MTAQKQEKVPYTDQNAEASMDKTAAQISEVMAEMPETAIFFSMSKEGKMSLISCGEIKNKIVLKKLHDLEFDRKLQKELTEG